MNLNPNSFFMKNFLMYGEYDLPRTICQLGRRIVTHSIIWTFLLAAALLVATSLVVSAYGLLVVAFSDATILSWFGAIFGKDVQMTFYGTCLFISGMVLAAAAILAALFGIPYAYRSFKEKRREKERAAYYAAQDKGEVYVPAPTPVADFFSGMYKRFKDKTCVMLTYDQNEEESNP